MGITVNGSGGSGGSGTSASDMIYGGPVGGTTPWVNVKGQDGYGWAGGAGAVQGNAATFSTGSGTASNEALSFNIGSTIASLNATYGAGNWTITNPTLTFASANFVQNNSRFGVGGGGFNIYYVANNQWGQSEAGTGGTYSPNPIYADGINQSATAAQKTLNTWAGSSSLLGTETYSTTGAGSSNVSSSTWISSGYGSVSTGTLFASGGRASYINESYSLAADPSFVSAVLSATTSSPDVSMYLMGTSNDLGMIIYTGGQSMIDPTLTFDVQGTDVPEPTTLALTSVLGGVGLAIGRWRKRKAASTLSNRK
ncbi:MAG: PEP-CTERM sorting domain-containing protein [Thermoguttaceae bacterium]